MNKARQCLSQVFLEGNARANDNDSFRGGQRLPFEGIQLCTNSSWQEGRTERIWGGKGLVTVIVIMLFTQVMLAEEPD